MGMLIEKYIGKTGKRLFLLFCWLFTLLVIAAFTDMVAGTFASVGVANITETVAYDNASGGTDYLFPTLFVTIACGAVSGFHSLVSSGTSSKTISNEKDMAMVVESLLDVVALVVVGAVAVGGQKPAGTPFAIFSSGAPGFSQ